MEDHGESKSGKQDYPGVHARVETHHVGMSNLAGVTTAVQDAGLTN
jgi:hypothetical protein